jgi:glycosyltransferase involved in cell wall biosynthesis
VGEFVEAARQLRAAGVGARFVLAGGEDSANPAAIPHATLAGWVRDGHVEWWGHRTDMAATLAEATIVCLPSYREGLPKALLEGAAVGRPLVATDVPGCREVVTDGENGLLVPARAAKPLADALRRLIDDPALAQRMGRRAREIAERDFAASAVVSRTLELYR